MTGQGPGPVDLGAKPGQDDFAAVMAAALLSTSLVVPASERGLRGLGRRRGLRSGSGLGISVTIGVTAGPPGRQTPGPGPGGPAIMV